MSTEAPRNGGKVAGGASYGGIRVGHVAGPRDHSSDVEVPYLLHVAYELASFASNLLLCHLVRIPQQMLATIYGALYMKSS